MRLSTTAVIMSKHQRHLDERIPSYEESIAASPPSSRPATTEKTSTHLSVSERARIKRVRLITDLVTTDVEPQISQHIEDGINRVTVIIVPSDAFPSSNSILQSSITSPTLPANSYLLRPATDDYRASFLHQSAVIQELASTIATSLVGPSSLQASPPSLPTSSVLPTRPDARQRTSFRYMFGIPDRQEHDPTGSTGSWNLGWRAEADAAATVANVNSSDVDVMVRLQDVSFRTENEMGLLESKNVKCVWCEVVVKT